MKQSELERVLTSLAHATGLEVCFYDLNFMTSELSDAQLPKDLLKHCSPYCMEVKQNSKAHKQCIDNEYKRIALASKTDKPFIHCCHAGLTDMVVPVRLGERLIGAIFIGQVWTPPEDAREKAIRRLVRTYKLDAEKLRKAASLNHHSTQAKLEALHPLVENICKYWELKERVFMKEPFQDTLTSLPSRLKVCDVSTRFIDTLKPTHPSIQKSLKILKNSYWDEVELPYIARKAGLSTSHFSRLFRTETSLTWRECLTRCRLEAVFYLSKRTALPVTKIAELLAYDSPASLMRMVKRETGLSTLALKSVQVAGWLLYPGITRDSY